MQLTLLLSVAAFGLLFAVMLVRRCMLLRFQGRIAQLQQRIAVNKTIRSL